MINLGLFIGCYIYLLLIISFVGLFYKNTIIIITLVFLIIALRVWSHRVEGLQTIKIKNVWRTIKKNKIITLLAILITLQIVINFIGAISPETSFDALWYHLTLAKIYSFKHKIIHIPGGLLYYSDMPKLIEIAYAAVLSFGNEISAKIVHFIFSILTLIAVYKLTAKQINKRSAVIAIALLSSNIVFAWESTTAYIDIGRSFFEVLALCGFLKWVEKKDTKWLMTTGVFIGLAITTKILGISSLIIFIMLCIWIQIKEKHYKKMIRDCLILIGISLAIPSPWFIFSFIHTGDPIFPFFTQIYQVKPALQSFNILKIVTDFWNMMLYSSDPISPIYIIILPYSFYFFPNMTKIAKIISVYSGLAILFWFATPRTGGGRFILPYLPVISIAAAATIDKLKEQKNTYNYVIFLVIIIALSTCIYRGVAEKKYLPVLLGQETKTAFLTQNLNFEFGDFYDIDEYFRNHIKASDKVLLYGFHNLYYIDFPFIDSSWIKKGDKFNYIALQNAEMPKRFISWKQIYENKRTHIKLYTKDKKLWTY